MRTLGDLVRFRLLASLACISVILGAATPIATAETPTPQPPAKQGLLTEEEATRSAEASGQPVEVTSLTDERTLVMAQPEGHFEATMSAGVARVRDGREGWRTPSARLVPGAGGALRPEAALSSIVVSGGGSGPLMSVGDGEHKVELGWPSALPAPIVEDSTATFPEVMAGVDLVVRAGIESAETFLVVKTPAAAANPNVRTALFGFSAPGLTVRELGNGARSLVDGRGVERFMIPEARMWDSSGKVPGLKRAADVVEESAEARSARVDVGVTANRLTLAADNSLLDDPETVFPVVIDPEVSLSQSYVVRVTESFRQVNDMDKDGKIGYNGWSSENGGYYKSRMFYQFRWPTSSSKQQILTGSQIIKADFRYLQRHSPQHACNTSYGPGVRVRLYNTIGADNDVARPIGSFVESSHYLSRSRQRIRGVCGEMADVDYHRDDESGAESRFAQDPDDRDRGCLLCGRVG